MSKSMCQCVRGGCSKFNNTTAHYSNMTFIFPNNIAIILFRKIKFVLILRNEPARNVYDSDTFDLAFRMLRSCDNNFWICVFD